MVDTGTTSHTVVRYHHGEADTNRGFLLFGDRLDGTRGAHLAAEGTIVVAVALVESHIGLQEAVKTG